MKKYISLMLALGITLGAGSLTQAAETPTKKTPAEVTPKIEEAIKVQVANHAIPVLQRLGKVLTEQAVVGAKLESRVSKLKDQGADVTGAVVVVKEAHTLWDKARVDLEALPKALEKILEENTAQNAAGKIRDSIQKIIDQILTVHENLGAAIPIVVNLAPKQ